MRIKSSVIAQQIRTLTTIAHGLGSIAHIHMVERTSSHRLPSDLHMCIITQMCAHKTNKCNKELTK